MFQDDSSPSSDGPAVPEPPPAPPAPAAARAVARAVTRAGHPARPDAGRSMAIVTGAWVFGSVFATAVAGAPMTLFAERLGATPFVFGLLAAAPFAASLLSLPAAMWSDYSGRRKSIFLWALYLHRLLWIPIGIVPPWLYLGGHVDGPLALGLFVGLVALMHCFGAIGGPAWMSWMADIVPRRVRGRYFARRRQWGIVSALPTALLVGFLLDRLVRGDGPTPVDDRMVLLVCGGIFVIASIFGIIDIALFHLVPHTLPPPRKDEGFGQVLKALMGSLGTPVRDRRFLAFAGFVAMLTLASAPSGQFTTLLLVRKLQINNLLIQTILLVAPMLTQLLTAGLWGRAIDRFGKKATLTLGTAGIIPVGLGWAWLSAHSEAGFGWPQILLAYLVGAGGGFFWTAIEIANFNYVLDLAGTAKGASKESPANVAGGGYVAVNSVIINIAGMAGGLLFGKVASATQGVSIDAGATFGLIDSFTLLFLLTAGLRLVAGLVFLPLVKEDPAFRHHRARDTLRFMAANLYNNVQTAMLQPIRLLRVRPRDTFRA